MAMITLPVVIIIKCLYLPGWICDCYLDTHTDSYTGRPTHNLIILQHEHTVVCFLESYFANELRLLSHRTRYRPTSTNHDAFTVSIGTFLHWVYSTHHMLKNKSIFFIQVNPEFVNGHNARPTVHHWSGRKEMGYVPRIAIFRLRS